MTLTDYAICLEALTSCAIEGNQFAIELLKLRESNQEEFLIQLEKFARKEAES